MESKGGAMSKRSRSHQDSSMPNSQRHLLTGSESPFGSLELTLHRFFYKPDLQALRIVLGTLKSHYLNLGDPAWLFLVAPPGTGKTTMAILSASGLPSVIPLGALTENTFLSGFYGQREPGLLEKLGPTVQEGRTYTTTGDAIFV